MIRDEMYYQVSGWMTTKLGLKGLKRELYAIIYGFTQDGQNEFSGSISYLTEWLDVSPRTIINILQELADKDLIIIIKNKGLKNKYRANLEKLTEPMQNLHNTYAKNALVIDNSNNNQYNIVDNNYNNNKETLKESQFEQFWKEYPKKVDKKGSYRAFVRIEKLDEKFETIMNALKDQKHSLQWQKENGQYIPNPTTWIHQERWEQVLPKAKGEIITHEYTKEDFDNMYDSLDDIEV